MLLRLVLVSLVALTLLDTPRSEARPSAVPLPGAKASTKIWDRSQKKVEFKSGHEQSFSTWSIVRSLSRCEELLGSSSHLLQSSKETMQGLNAQLNTDFETLNAMCGPFCVANSLNLIADRGDEQLLSVIRNVQANYPDFNQMLSARGMWARELIAVADNVKPDHIALSYHAATDSPKYQKPDASERSLSPETLGRIGQDSVAIGVVRVGHFRSLLTYNRLFGEEYRPGLKPTDEAVWRQDKEIFRRNLKIRDGGHYVVIKSVEAIGENAFRLVIMDPLRSVLYEWRASIEITPEGSHVLRIFDSRYQPYLTIHPNKRHGHTQILFEGTGVVLSDLILLSNKLLCEKNRDKLLCEKNQEPIGARRPRVEEPLTWAETYPIQWREPRVDLAELITVRTPGERISTCRDYLKQNDGIFSGVARAQ